MPDRFDILTFDQQNAIMEALDFPVGKRLGALIDQLGLDESVRIASRSAKQLKRYVNGDEPPMTVMQNLSRAAGASLDWLVEAEPRSKMDCLLERHILEEEQKRRTAALASAETELDRVMQEFALAAVQGLLEIADSDSKRLPERSGGTLSFGVKERLEAARQRQGDKEQLLTRGISAQEQTTSTKAAQSFGNAVIDEEHGNDNLVSIPVYEDVRPAAGAGAVSASDQSTSVVAFDRRWLRDLGINPSFAKILFADGDSMYPTIRDGAPMLVDTSKTEIRHGCIYVFDLDGDLMVKRIERLPDGTIDLISDNREVYPVRNIPRSRLDLLHVIGRVFLTIRTF